VTEALGALLFFSPFRATFGSFTFDFAILLGLLEVQLAEQWIANFT
jgi:hypothetical protein